MYISKPAKDMLKNAARTPPAVQDKYHSAIELARAHKICSDNEALLIVRFLEENGFVSVPYNTRPDLFCLTETGLHYREFCFHFSVEFFCKSVLCPIVVTVITEAIIHGAPALLEWLSQLVR